MHQLLTTTNTAEHCMNKAKAFAVDVFRSVPPCWVLEEVQTSPRRRVPGALKIRELTRAPDQRQWSFRLRAGSDHEFVRRAEGATEWLGEQLRESATIVVVTHAGFRRILAARLLARGWRWQSTSPGGRYAHWRSWELAHHG
jgi:broad specificity phosphatase PhoE